MEMVGCIFHYYVHLRCPADAMCIALFAAVEADHPRAPRVFVRRYEFLTDLRVGVTPEPSRAVGRIGLAGGEGHLKGNPLKLVLQARAGFGVSHGGLGWSDESRKEELRRR